MATSNNIMQGEWNWQNIDPYTQAILQQQQQNDMNQWGKMVKMLPLMTKLNDEQMIGYGLGRLLRDGLLSWKKNYEERGERKKNDKSNPGNWNESDYANIKASNPAVEAMGSLSPAPEGTPAVWNVPNKNTDGGTSLELGKTFNYVTDKDGNVYGTTQQTVAVPEQGLLGLPMQDARNVLSDSEYYGYPLQLLDRDEQGY